MKMKSIFVLHLVVVLLCSTTLWSAVLASHCPSDMLPQLVGGENVSSIDSQCPTDQQRQEALRSLNSRVDSAIDSVLPRIEALLAPSPCEGPGWQRIAYIDMKNESYTCPGEWELLENGVYRTKRLCGRTSLENRCRTATFDTGNIIDSYTKVCGRIVAYQYGTTEAFLEELIEPDYTIDDNYVDGVSITHGSPRKHIWTFASGSAERGVHFTWKCPCENINPMLFPAFVPHDSFFCDTGREYGDNVLGGPLYVDDPLWDGYGCGPESDGCCSFNDPPYFLATLPEPTCDNIDVRLCASEDGEDTPIELIELYVK